MKLKNTRSLTFSDVNLLSEKISKVNSRNEVKIDNHRIIVAPMSAIQNDKFNTAAIAAGLSLPIHRFCSIEQQHDLLYKAVATKTLINSESLLWLSVGLNDFEKRIDPIYQFMQDNQVGVLFDVANGFANNLTSALKIYNAKYELPNLMTGNVHTWAGFEHLENYESKFIRAGIGGGQACETSGRTGIARGQMSVIMDIAPNLRTAMLISDGGIRSAADLAKAFGAGADYVMAGGIFAQAMESEAQKTGQFYGGASSVQKGLLGSKKDRFVEGKSLDVQYSEKSLQTLVTELTDGLRSAISYSGYHSLESFINNGIFELCK